MDFYCICWIDLLNLSGDFHIPFRAYELPAKFRKLLVPNKMQHILCTGEFLLYLSEKYLALGIRINQPGSQLVLTLGASFQIYNAVQRTLAV